VTPTTEPNDTPATRRNYYPWVLVGMLWFICFLNYADRVAISSVFPILKDKFHFSKTELALIGSAFSYVYAACAPFAGWVGDRLTRKSVIIGGLYIWSLVTGFTGLCGKFWQFVAVRATEGLGETFYIPASMSIIGDYHGKATRSRAIGIHQTSIYGGTIFGGALAGWMGARYGWQSPFIFLGGAGIILGLILATFIREPRRGHSEEPLQFDDSNQLPLERPTQQTLNPTVIGIGFGAIFGVLLWQVLRAAFQMPHSQAIAVGMSIGIPVCLIASRSLARSFGPILGTNTALLLLLGFTGTNSVALVFLIWAPTYLHEAFNVEVAKAGLMATATVQIGSMFGAVLGGLMADRIRGQMQGGRILIQGIGTLLGIPFLAIFSFEPQLNLALVALSCFGIAKGIHDANISAGFFDVVPLRSRAAAVGMLNFVGWGAGAAWTVLFGMMADNKVPMGTIIGYNAGIYAFVCAVFFYAALVRAPKDIAA
jgi:MFS family permease